MLCSPIVLDQTVCRKEIGGEVGWKEMNLAKMAVHCNRRRTCHFQDQGNMEDGQFRVYEKQKFVLVPG